ncbi:MAG: hypothetical protein K2N34_14705 [Lachnospiraceae bacterium]|nr:hypothetical protein [Lachnospiraceae bacterium]
MFTINYKGKKYSDEEVSKRIETAISVESDVNTRILLMNLSNIRLSVLNSLSSDIQEICDCLFLKKYMAALTLTNLLFETMVKLTLVCHEADGRTVDDGYEFENIYEDELNKYGKKNLGENIEALYKKDIITVEVRDRLLDLKDLFRNPYSHGSNNLYVENATTTIYKGQLGSNDIEECKVPVTGNPAILLDARRAFVKRWGLSYFVELVIYIEMLDKELHKLYNKRFKSE